MKQVLGICMVAMLGLTGCGDVGDDLAPQGQDKASRGAILSGLPVADAVQDFTGEFTVTSLDYENNQLTVSGVLSYVQEGETVTQEVSDVPAALTPGTPVGSANVTLEPARTCDVLFLDLGPLFLDLLGLQVDLSPIELDIDAVSGPGNLLGNLLCSLTGLLDGGPLAGIERLIDNINRILDGVTA